MDAKSKTSREPWSHQLPRRRCRLIEEPLAAKSDVLVVELERELELELDKARELSMGST